jgi:hypothetical protein
VDTTGRFTRAKAAISDIETRRGSGAVGQGGGSVGPVTMARPLRYFVFAPALQAADPAQSRIAPPEGASHANTRTTIRRPPEQDVMFTR